MCIKERDYFPKVLSTKQTVISNPLIGKADGKLAIVVAVPIFRDGTMIGILGANVKAQEIIQQVKLEKLVMQLYIKVMEQSLPIKMKI